MDCGMGWNQKVSSNATQPLRCAKWALLCAPRANEAQLAATRGRDFSVVATLLVELPPQRRLPEAFSDVFTRWSGVDELLIRSSTVLFYTPFCVLSGLCCIAVGFSYYTIAMMCYFLYSL